MLAEKLNQMNDLEQTILDKERDLQAEKFYLEKQWAEMEEAGAKVTATLQNPPPPNQRANPAVRSSAVL